MSKILYRIDHPSDVVIETREDTDVLQVPSKWEPHVLDIITRWVVKNGYAIEYERPGQNLYVKPVSPQFTRVLQLDYETNEREDTEFTLQYKFVKHTPPDVVEEQENPFATRDLLTLRDVLKKNQLVREFRKFFAKRAPVQFHDYTEGWAAMNRTKVAAYLTGLVLGILTVVYLVVLWIP